MLNERYGKVYIDFAEPVSVRDLFQLNGLQRSLPTPESPQDQYTLSANEKMFCVDVAHRVVQQQQRHSVISAFNLISIFLNNSVLEGCDPPLISEVTANVSWLKSVMEVLGALVDIQGKYLHSTISAPLCCHRNQLPASGH
jgi:glycerone phosphate O-acyltransferase